MPSKISPELDMKILELIALGLPNKEIALRLGVSPSYVSKVKTGKKVPCITLTPLTPLEKELLSQTLVSDDTIKEHLNAQINEHLFYAQLYKTILRRMNNE